MRDSWVFCSFEDFWEYLHIAFVFMNKDSYYEDLESDSRVRKPLDDEQEKKMQKMKSEKTKRELHVQELDHKIHILE